MSAGTGLSLLRRTQLAVLLAATARSARGARRLLAEPAAHSAEAGELATVEVSAAPDAAYSIADDKVERRANPNAIAGALPDGFPTDIPVYLPSSLVDFTSRPEGGAVVVFATPASVSTVSAALSQKLRAAGWQAARSGDWTKAGPEAPSHRRSERRRLALPHRVLIAESAAAAASVVAVSGTREDGAGEK